MGPIQVFYRRSAPLDALGVFGVEFKTFRHQVLTAVCGLCHSVVSVFVGVGEDMKELMRQDAAEGAAEQRLPFVRGVTDSERSNRIADSITLQFAERKHAAVRGFGRA